MVINRNYKFQMEIKTEFNQFHGVKFYVIKTAYN
jgi:hypothetical protein